jgi:hypothetical protein
MLSAGTEIRVSTTLFAVREMYTTGKSVRAVYPSCCARKRILQKIALFIAVSCVYSSR